MSLRFVSERLTGLRHDAQRFVGCTGDHEGQLEAFVAAAERGMGHAEAAASHAADELGRGTHLPANVRPNIIHLMAGDGPPDVALI